MPSCPNCSFTIDSNAKVCPWCEHAVNADYASVKDSSGVVAAGSDRISALMRRYRDAYLVAKVTDGFGGMIKGIGIVIAVLLALVSLMLMGKDASFALGVVMLMSGIIAGVWIYIAGVLVSTQGQILKASLDGAVNSSPFLADEHKAKIMSLPEA